LGFESIDFVPHRIVDLVDFSSDGDLLLSSGELFLSDPAVDASDLRLKVGLDVSDRLVFALELLPDVGVHLLVSIS